MSAAFSPDGRKVATASDDNTARLWDAETGTEIVVLQGHEGSLRSAAWRPNQQAPKGDWRTWLLLAGRGFGKTRSGAECIRDQVIHHRRRRIALVAPTAADARDVMVEGESGLLAIGPPQQRPQ